MILRPSHPLSSHSFAGILRPLVVVLLAVTLCSCSTALVRHLPAQNVRAGQRDSLNRQLGRAEVRIAAKGLVFDRKPGLTRLWNDTLFLRSSVLFDTLRIPLDSVREFRCYEHLPLSTVVLATAGGAAAGFVIGKVGSHQDQNSGLTTGLSVIGAVMGGFGAWISDRETIYLIDRPLLPNPPALPENSVPNPAIKPKEH